MEELDATETHCHDEKVNYLSLIKDSETTLDNSHIDLAGCVADEQTTDIGLDDTMTKHDGLEDDMLNERYECSKKLKIAKSEACALRKIRGELKKIKGVTYIPFFKTVMKVPGKKKNALNRVVVVNRSKHDLC